MFGAKFNHESRFFADGYELSGVESVGFSYENNPSIIKPLGTKQGFTVSNSPTQQTASLSRVLTYNDPILNYTGEDPISGSMFYDDKYYGFESGYLTDYSLNCAVGTVPRVTANFQLLSELKSGVNASLPQQTHPTIDIPTQGSIVITCDNSSTDRVVGFDYGIRCLRKAYFTVDSLNPSAIELLPPVEYNATVQIEVDQAFLDDSYSFFDSKEEKNVSISINGRNGASIQNVTIPNATLVGEDLQASADGALRLTLTYVGHGASDEASLSFDNTYVFDSNGEILDSDADNIADFWKSQNADVYGVQFGSNVNSIGVGAFSGAPNIGGDLFVGTTENGIIGDGAFYDGSGFNANLILEENILTIGDSAFENCGFVSSLIIPDSVSGIGNRAFYGCKNFDGTLRMPDTLTSWGEGSFKNCSSFTGPLVLSNYTSVPNNSFENCSGFNGSLTLPTNAATIGEKAFKNCSKLNGRLDIPAATTSINSGAFENCNNLYGLSLNNSLVDIKENSFKNCYQITSDIVIPNNVVTISTGAFNGCSKIKSLSIGDDVAFIRSGAFQNCVSLTGSLDFKNTTQIEAYSFSGCVGINGKLDILSVQDIGEGAFENCKNIKGSVIDAGSWVSIGEKAFKNCTSLDGDVSLSLATENIYDESFYNCGFTGSLDISNCIDLDYIGKNAFRNCKFSNQLVFPPDIASITISKNAFRDCDGFTGNLSIPSSVVKISDAAFKGCLGIKDVFVDCPIERFEGGGHFNGVGGCLYVSSRYYDEYYASLGVDGLVLGMPLCRGSVDSNVFRVSDGVSLKEWQGDISVDGYNKISPYTLSVGYSASNINDVSFISETNLVGSLAIPSSIDRIGTQAFQGCVGLDGTLEFENGIKTIELEAFSGCNGFNGGLVIPDSVETIGNSAFDGCTGFDGSISLSNSLTTLGESAFIDCQNIKGDLTIPGSLTGVEDFTFRRCSGVESLTIENGLEYLGVSAFRAMKKIAGNLTIPNTVTQIDTSCFRDCNSLSELKFEAGVQNLSIEGSAFRSCDSLGGDIIINSNISNIGSSVFFNCSGVDALYVDIPQTSVGVSAFQLQGVQSQEKIMFVTSGHLASYGAGPYYDNNLLQLWRKDSASTILYDAGLAELTGIAGDIPQGWNENNVLETPYSISIGSSTQRIEGSAFSNNTFIDKVLYIPSNIQYIGSSAFSNCTNMPVVIFQDGVGADGYGDQAFENCQSIQKVKMTKRTKPPGVRMFEGCDDLRKVEIGEYISKQSNSSSGWVGELAFAYCGLGITNGNVSVEGSIFGIEQYAFYGYSSYRWIKTLNINVREIKYQVFAYQTNLEFITFGERLRKINDNNYGSSQAFEGCTSLQEINIPYIEEIGGYAFLGCNSINSINIGNDEDIDDYNKRGDLKQDSYREIGTNVISGSLYIGSSISYVGYRAFYGDFNWLLTADLNCREIGEEAFEDQTRLNDLTLRESVIAVRAYAFDGCSALSIIKCYANNGLFKADSLVGSSVLTIQVRSSDNTWTAGVQTIGGKSVTVAKTL